MIRNILFDLDGTLVDTALDLTNALNAVRLSCKLPQLPIETIRPTVLQGASMMIKVGFGVEVGDPEFDEIRKKFQQERNTPFYNLTPPIKGKGPGHPFIASVLGKYMDHMKGTQRKELGHSLPDDVSIRNQNINGDVDYWKNIKSR